MAKPSRSVLAVAGVALLPLVLVAMAMAKPCRVEAGAMPKASLGIRAMAQPSRPVLAVAGVALQPLVLVAMAEPSRPVPGDRCGRSLAAGLVPRATLVVPTRTFPNSVP